MSTTTRVLSGRYRLDDRIARGGMADVYRGTDLRLERPVAVKVLRDFADAARFGVEARTLAGLRHPNLVSLLDAGTDDPSGAQFLVLELRDEPTLAALLRDGPLPAARAAAVITGLARALAYVHARGIVHRDVKPGNVFIDDRDETRLGDFGIARAADATALTATGFTIGTIAYLAPEQVDGRAVTAAADVYALGLVMIESLDGRAVFAGNAVEVASARLVRDPEIPATVPPRWRALVQAMTSRDPALRPSAARVATELRAVAQPSTTRTLPVAIAGDASRSPRPRLRRNVVALVGLALATFAGVLAMMGVGGGGPDPSTTTSRPAGTTTTAPTAAAVTAAPTSTTVGVAVPPSTSPRRAPHHERQPKRRPGEHGGD